jgi:predicted nucleic acid-binding protein
MSKVNIKVISPNNSSDMNAVIKMWRKHSDTLGFFPEGAFHDYAAKKQILLAHDASDNILGYLLYRISKHKVSITHLCISLVHRGNGLSRLFIDALRSETYGLRGIGLFCRRDFSVNSLWPKLEFIPVHEKKGRGKSKETLTYWWLDYGNPTLFSESMASDINNKISVVIDANVFYDLDLKNNRPENVEAKALDADWFKGETTVLLTEEIYNEINRRDCEDEREYQRKRVFNFDLITSDRSNVISIEKEISALLRKPRKAQDYSDIRQISHAISGQANYFITRDEYILGQSDLIYDKYGLNIKRPAEIILDIDSLYDEVSYRPARLAGTHAALRLVTSNEISMLGQSFCLQKQGEKVKTFQKKLAAILAQTDKYRVFVVEDVSGEPLSIYATTIDDCGNPHILLARVREGILASTLARYLLASLIRSASDKELTSVTFKDGFMQPTFSDALNEEGFLLCEELWIKIIINKPMTVKGIEMEIINGNLMISDDVNKEKLQQNMLDMLGNIPDDNNTNFLAILESYIWPGKIIDNDMPCYIVPIKAGWAKELFDESLASQDLFGATLDLAIQNEGVYYYSARGARTSAPARVLWYVSQDKNIHGSGAIRACSTIINVSIDKPKPLFKRYRRLGIYSWNDVYRTANNDINNKIVAIHFGKTELFKNPIDWQALQTMLSGVGNINKSIITATPIPSEVFMKMYKQGVNINA